MQENEVPSNVYKIPPEKTPTMSGLHRFVGYRRRSLRNDFETLDEVVLVEWTHTLNDPLEFYVLRFGKTKKQPTSEYQGDWYYIGDAIERITDNPRAAAAAKRQPGGL